MNEPESKSPRGPARPDPSTQTMSLPSLPRSPAPWGRELEAEQRICLTIAAPTTPTVIMALEQERRACERLESEIRSAQQLLGSGQSEGTA